MNEVTQTMMWGMLMVFGMIITSLVIDGDLTGYTVKVENIKNEDNELNAIECGLLEIRYGDSCCADIDEDDICDEHELKPEGFCPDLDNNGICDNIEIEEPKPFKIPETSSKESRKGFTIALDAFEYEIYEDWGKITRVNFTIVNNGDHIISPIVQIDVYDLNYNGAYRSPHIKLDTTLAPGEFIVMPAYVDVSFTNLEKPKIIELGLKNKAAWPYTPIVTLQHEWRP